MMRWLMRSRAVVVIVGLTMVTYALYYVVVTISQQTTVQMQTERILPPSAASDESDLARQLREEAATTIEADSPPAGHVLAFPK